MGTSQTAQKLIAIAEGIRAYPFVPGGVYGALVELARHVQTTEARLEALERAEVSPGGEDGSRRKAR